MTENPPALMNHPYAAFLDRVEKPARYSGGEVGAILKDWSTVQAKVCLAFPDIYDIGMSHLGFKILYKILNDDPRTLAERCYAPWVDMEAELVARSLPLVSLESARPLRDFDVVGFSLQFELTYSNILTMLHLGGVPLRAADRGENDPLVIAGGPTATHPEPVAAFFDAFVIGDGEEKATSVAITWTSLKNQGVPRADRLIALAKLGGVYVPSLYATEKDVDTGIYVVDRPLLKGIPFPIDRALVDLNDYPFPDDGPTGGPEAIFDRMSIEIARGCTEGCRFCQAGMIYRPVRERDPEQIVETVVRAIQKSGQDEVSLTALSTADVSCIAPLIKKVVGRLSSERVSLGVSSLRAYGLEPDLLDELKRVRAAGLTFAPEAGSQRMRDVVNKNVTEEQLHETAERVFSRGFGKMKLYFMIGLPTETDEDVRGVIETGIRTAQVGKRAARGKPADVTVSVSTHVPKPHTPFQWAAMDTLSEVSRKQQILRDGVRGYKAVKLKTHGADASVLEAIYARGDRPLADVLERAWRAGARFDSWDEKLRLDLWEEAFQHYGIDKNRYLGTIPLSARLPWNHIDVGLEDGFLAKEYRKALQNRLSPPCGKAVGAFVHATNKEDAIADTRRLVCYDCGVACDMTQMRQERIDFLDRLGATKRSLPILNSPNAENGSVHAATSKTPEPNKADPSEVPPAAIKLRQHESGRGGHRYRFQFEKTGPAALLGHLDIVRELPRIFRRVEQRLTYTKGFHPKPDMIFAPALSLGVMSISEYADMRLDDDLDVATLAALVTRMNASSPGGLVFRDAKKLDAQDPAITKVITGARYGIAFARSALASASPDGPETFLENRCHAAMAAASLPIRRDVEGLGKLMDVRSYLRHARVADPQTMAAMRHAGLVGDIVVIDVEAEIRDSGAIKSSEIAAVIAGDGVTAPPHRAVRLELFCSTDESTRFSPLDLELCRSKRGPFAKVPGSEATSPKAVLAPEASFTPT